MSQCMEGEFVAWATVRQGAWLRSALLLTGDQASAEDLVQDALLKVAERWSRLRDEAPDAYARRIIYNGAMSRFRRHSREPAHAVVPEVIATATTDDWLSGADIRAALQRLTTKQRAVLVLRYYEDLSERQIAEALGVTAGTVKSQAHAGLRRLREELALEQDSLDGEEIR
ncbi:SigE family RNA polymerase sigma factor [Ornithinimicrobium cavernae]|uniref:SigE family RNA polymerase sigma factor n=1 Tax=Ornithinimicrobium cavernae TaxID=2666047 RepID=UPI001F1D8340|nr:SigE family RNA polymerase sigma factor [Ornithinimicrobium cavernae]